MKPGDIVYTANWRPVVATGECEIFYEEYEVLVVGPKRITTRKVSVGTRENWYPSYVGRPRPWATKGAALADLQARVEAKADNLRTALQAQEALVVACRAAAPSAKSTAPSRCDSCGCVKAAHTDGRGPCTDCTCQEFTRPS